MHSKKSTPILFYENKSITLYIAEEQQKLNSVEELNFDKLISEFNNIVANIPGSSDITNSHWNCLIGSFNPRISFKVLSITYLPMMM